jgi:hypothetical protein
MSTPPPEAATDEATPRPWSRKFAMVDGPNGEEVCSCGRTGVFYKENPAWAANAALIVEAVNQHARLLAVKQAAERLKAIHDDGEVGDNIVPLMEAEDALWAALATCNEQEAGE